MKLKISLLSSLISASLLSGCGFEVEKNVIEPLPPALEGQFVDSAVAGIQYERTSIEGEVTTGETDANGNFEYFRGDRIVFKVGNLTLPEISPKNFVTPLNFFTTDNPVAPQVGNLARLLQSLDTDGNPENGITISPSARDFAQMNLKTDEQGEVIETVEEFFNRSQEDFAAAIEPWLNDAVPENQELTGMVSYDQAVAHFVKNLEENFGDVQSSAFDLGKFEGPIFYPHIVGSSVVEQVINFVPTELPEDSEETSGKTGTYTITQGEETVQTGGYEFVFGRRILALTHMEGESESKRYIVSLGFDNQSEVYSLCEADDSKGLASVVANCDALNQRNLSKFAFSQVQNDLEVTGLEEAAESLAVELKEDFNTDTDNFFSSNYKRLSSDIGSGALYSILSGSPVIEDGALVLDGDRIAIGNTTSGRTTTPDDTEGTGIYNLSEGFTISFTVVSASGEGNLYFYADNSTASQSQSLHGDISKMAQIDLATGETTEGGLFTLGADLPTLKIGERVTFTYEGNGFDKTKNSFIQFRASGGTTIVIDDLEIDTIADSVGAPDEPTGPTGPVQSEIQIDLPQSFDFTTVSGDLFSSETFGIDGNVDSSGQADPLFFKEGGTVTLTNNGLLLDGGRFTIGNTQTAFESTDEDDVDVGVFDLSKPYTIVMDIIDFAQTEAQTELQVFVDNNTSGSANSQHEGSSSRIFQQDVSTLTKGELRIPGTVGTQHSYIQIRTEGGSSVEINNLRIEYVDYGDPDANLPDGDGGFAGLEGEITGGAGGLVTTVATGTDLVAALDEAKSASSPITIYVKGTITPENSGNTNRSLPIKDMENVSIIGVGTEGELDGIGFQIERSKNIIIRNLTIHEVPAGFGDAIGIQSDQGQDNTSRIWIDHNELYGSLSVDKDFYDELIGTRYNARNITISYNYIHDHQKTMLNGSSDNQDEKGDRFITWHHNRFENLGSRVPLFRFGFGHLYNNYFNNITGSGINSRMGAQLLVENNVFENVKNPIVSLDSEEKGFWNVRGNIFTDVSYSSADSLDLAKETTFAIEGEQSTSTYEVTYDYSEHLQDASEVKAYVLANAGVGKIDQSADNIPDVNGGSDNGGDNGGDNGDAENGVITEDFSAADTDTFFSAAYAGLPENSNIPLYARQSTNEEKVSVANGELLISNSRITVGRELGYDVETASDLEDPLGSLDLSHGVIVSFKLVSIALAADSDKTEDLKYFQLHIDNNTGSSSKSTHGGASKFWQGTVEELKGKVGETFTVETDLGTANSFIQLRAESFVTAVVDDLVITPKSPSYTEDFSAADAATFFSADYKSLPTDDSKPLYIKTGGGVEPVNGELVLGGSSGGRFTIGDTGVEASADAVEPKGVLDLSNGATVSFKLIDAQGEEKGFFVYIDNNTSSSDSSYHGGSSKITVGKLVDLTPQIGDIITVDVPVGTATSFIQLRTESNLTVTIDDLVITPK